MTIEVTAARYAGQRVPRVEDPRLVTGHGAYVDDVALPGLVHACFVRSPHARGRIRSIDVTEARAVRGVHAVFTAADLNPDELRIWHRAYGRPDTPQVLAPPLAIDAVRFVGDPVALVIAEDRYTAEDACDLVVVEIEPLDAVVDYTHAQTCGAEVHDGFTRNVAGTVGGQSAAATGDVFASAAHVVDVTIVQQACAAVPMETRGIVASWMPATGEMTIWTSTQSPHEVRALCARLLDLPEQRLRVIAGDVGGAFGQKIQVQREEMCIVLAAKHLARPVKWIEDRRENLLTASQARREHGAVGMAFDADGAILAARIDLVQDVGAYPAPWPHQTAGLAGSLYPGPYRVPAATFRGTCVFTNTVGRAPYRGPWQFESLGREVLLDIAAREIGIDPIELRRRNLLAASEMPYTNPNGVVYDHVTPRETFEQALAVLGYEQFRAEQAAAREVGRYLGVGTSTYVEPTTPGGGVYATEAATIRIDPSGGVTVFAAGGSAGNSLETAVRQLAADALSVRMEDVTVVLGDTALTPYGAGTGGSRSASMLAGAVGETATILVERLRTIAAARLEASEDDLELVDGRVRVRGTPTMGMPYGELAQIAHFDPRSLPEGVPAGLEATARYVAPTSHVWANATHICTCEVDVHTGQVVILRYIVGEDCGPMLNPSIVEGQIAGGTVQGIGGVLLEHLAYDDDGNPRTSTFMDYLLPTSTEVPVIEHTHVETRGPGAGGYKGVGEGGAIGAPPAVVNAIADALVPFGVTVTALPLGPSEILGLLGARTDPSPRRHPEATNAQ